MLRQVQATQQPELSARSAAKRAPAATLDEARFEGKVRFAIWFPAREGSQRFSI